MAENGSFAALEKWVPPFRSQLLSLSLSLPVAHDQTLSLPKPQPNRANERAREEEGTRERGERREGGGLLLGSFDTTSSSPAIPPARPPDRWNTLRRGGRGYRQLESWHQTTMGGGEEGEEKKPDGRATAAKCLLVQSASRPPSLPPSTRFSTVVIRHLRRHRRRPSKISSGFDS